MHRNLIRILRFTPVRVLYCFTSVFVIPFCFLFGRARKAVYPFYRERLGYGAVRSLWLCYRNLCLFAQVVIDKFAMYAGKHFTVEIEGTDHFQTLVAGEEGFVQLSSHVGNYEIAGYSLRSERKTIHAVVFSDEKESVMRNRSQLFGRTNVSMIALREDMGHLFEIDAALRRGDIVSFPTDRHLEGSRCLKASFLGREAAFPQGPFQVAAMRGVSVMAVHVMKAGGKRYRIYLTPLPYGRDLPRHEQMRQLCEGYAAELERMVRLYPTQWFNYFDFWA